MLHLDVKGVHSMISSNENLSTFYKWVLNRSTSLTLPYHNLRHTFCMMQLIGTIWNHSQTDDSYGFKLSDEDLYVLLVSALFHDFSHSGGVHSDKENVANAIAGLERCLDECTEYSSKLNWLKSSCASVIRATEYPYVIPDEDLDLRQRIIRECDILVAFFDDVFLQNIIGLSAEMRMTDVPKYVMDWLKFIMDSSKKFQLKYSLDVIDKYSAELVDEMKTFIETWH